MTGIVTPNSDEVSGVPLITRIYSNNSNSTGGQEWSLAKEERIGNKLFVAAAKAEL